jgi:DNA-binding NarL/FixJ family response regulator
MCTPIKVFLLAGNRLLREALVRILRKPPDMVLAGEAFDYGSALSVIGDTAADVLLMDSASMPPLTLALLGQVRRVCPAVQALVIGMDESEAAFLQAVRAGVSG